MFLFQIWEEVWHDAKFHFVSYRTIMDVPIFGATFSLLYSLPLVRQLARGIMAQPPGVWERHPLTPGITSISYLKPPPHPGTWLFPNASLFLVLMGYTNVGTLFFCRPNNTSTYINKCMHTYTYIRTYIRTYICSYIHTYIHT